MGCHGHCNIQTDEWTFCQVVLFVSRTGVNVKSVPADKKSLGLFFLNRLSCLCRSLFDQLYCLGTVEHECGADRICKDAIRKTFETIVCKLMAALFCISRLNALSL